MGFTLIELLIVIVVLGILAAVVVFALGGVTSQSAVSACQADGATVATAMAAFTAQNSGTTVSQSGLLKNSPGGSTPYIQSWPSNLPHYAFAINSGALFVYTGATSTKPFTTSSGTANATPGSITSAGLPATIDAAHNWIAWSGNGPSACAGVK